MKEYSLFRDGDWVDSKSNDFIEVENPATKEIIGKVPAANEEDVNLAVQGAKKALPSWMETSLEKRIEYVEKIYSYIKNHNEEIAETISQELGAPIEFSKESQVQGYYGSIEDFIDIAKSYEFVEKKDGFEIHHEPVGIVACLTPWNYPLGQIIKKVIPALLAGNVVVLKPSKSTPISAYYMAQAAKKANLPKGVFQLVTGRGAEVGNLLASHKDINMVSFTGSTKGGKEVASLAQEGVKRVALELGGKSPALFIEGADYEKGLRAVLETVYYNTGQTCSAKTRLIVPKKDKEKIEKLLVKITEEFNFNDPRKSDTDVGPLQSKKQFEKVSKLVEEGKKEAKLLYQGQAYSNEGYYFPPTIFTDVDQNAKIAQEEIFGPVLAVVYYDDLDQALEIANNTIYGLSGMIFGEENKAKDIAKKIKTGQISINGADFSHKAPFGGFKQSGYGREGSIYGFEEFIELKTIFL